MRLIVGLNSKAMVASNFFILRVKTMPRLISKKSARHLSYLLPILLATGCSQTAVKDPLTQTSGGKFSVFTRNKNGNLHFEKNEGSSQHATVWDRMLSLYALPEMDNARIDREVNFYLKNPDYLRRVQQRAEPYLYFILDEIEAKNMPGELALLPIVESAFRPEAKSPAQASGLWQFIPPTGRDYGLEQNSWYDGRRDVVESTQAATTFLKELSYEFNNDWLLALASYNTGKGNIQHAIDRNIDRGLPTDFWSLNLNNETATYVPKLLAIAKIFAHPDRYNVDLHEIANEPYFEMVDVQSQIDLGKAAELAQTPLDEFLKLNPGFNRKSTAPDGPHRLLIPVEKADTFKEKLAELPIHERVKWEHHTVDETETLKTIAERHHSTIARIQEVNHLSDKKVARGKTLLIPVPTKAKDHDDEVVASASKQQARKLEYTIKKGDTLSSVSRNLSVDKDDLLSWNKLTSKSALKPGQKLTIKKSGGNIQVASAAPSFKQISYTVKPGESLAEISKKFKVNVADLRKWNNVPKNSANLKPGSKLKITVEAGHTSS